MELYTHRFTENLLHHLFDDLGGRGQNGGLVLRLTGFQDGVEIESPVGHVLTHAEEEAVEVVTQLDWLRAKQKGKKNIITVWYSSDFRFKYKNTELPPDFEVVENQLPSRESYPVNRPASRQQSELLNIYLKKMKLCCDTWQNDSN